MKDCLKCGCVYDDCEKKCPSCGARSKSRLHGLRCPQCAASIDAKDSMCQNCGYRFKAANSLHGAHRPAAPPSYTRPAAGRTQAPPPRAIPPQKPPVGQYNPDFMPLPPGIPYQGQKNAVPAKGLLSLVAFTIAAVFVFAGVVSLFSRWDGGNYQGENNEIITPDDFSSLTGAMEEGIESGNAQYFTLEELSAPDGTGTLGATLVPQGWELINSGVQTTMQSLLSPLGEELRATNNGANAQLILQGARYYSATDTSIDFPCQPKPEPQDLLRKGVEMEPLQITQIEERSTAAFSDWLEEAYWASLEELIDAVYGMEAGISEKQMDCYWYEGTAALQPSGLVCRYRARFALCSFTLSAASAVQSVWGVPFFLFQDYVDSPAGEEYDALMQVMAANYTRNNGARAAEYAVSSYLHKHSPRGLFRTDLATKQETQDELAQLIGEQLTSWFYADVNDGFRRELQQSWLHMGSDLRSYQTGLNDSLEAVAFPDTWDSVWWQGGGSNFFAVIESGYYDETLQRELEADWSQLE